MKFRKMKKEKIIVIFVLISMYAGATYYLYFFNNRQNKTDTLATQGILNLSTLENDEITRLNGKWEFYPDALIDPSVSSFDDYAASKTYVHLPSMIFTSNQMSHTQGTYRLIIDFPNSNTYAIKTKTIRPAFKLFVNGQLLHEEGKVSEDASQVITGSRYALIPFEAKNNRIELVIQIPAAETSQGLQGIVTAIEIGYADTMIRSHLLSMAISVFALSFLLILSLYFILLFIIDRKDKASLYFGILSLSFVIYISTVDEQVLAYLWDYTFTQRSIIQGLSLTLTAAFLLLFTAQAIGYIFKSKKIQYILGTLFISLFFILIFIKLPVVYLLLAPFYLLAFLSSILYSFLIMVNSKINSKYQWLSIVFFAVNLSIYFTFNILRIFTPIDLHKLPLIAASVSIASGSMYLLSLNRSKNIKIVELGKDLIDSYNQRSRFVDKLTAKVAPSIQKIHDLNVSLIQNPSSVLKVEEQRTMAFIHDETTRTMNLLDQLRYSTGAAGNFETKEASLLLIYEVVHEVLKDLSFEIKSKPNVEIKNMIGDHFPPLQGAYYHFYYIFNNLIENAIENTDKGVIKITGHVAFNKITLSISDTGVGIGASHLTKIFQPLYQIHPDATKYGLGLSVAKQFTELEEGVLSVESTLNVGTTFTLTFPITKTHSEMKTGITPRRYVRNPNFKNVLMIKSYNFETYKVISILEQNNFNVDVLKDISNLQMKFNETQYEMIILDWSTDLVSFMTFAEAIRKRYEMYEMPILLLGTPTTSENLQTMQDVGINGYIHRPFKADELIAKVDFLLQSKSAIKKSRSETLSLLHSRISPHFLYNTINNVIGEIGYDNDLSKQTLVNLSVYLRAKLDVYQDKALVDLFDEIELVISYLEIENFRYKQRLNIHLDINEDVEALIPPLTIQTIVENSMKHSFRENSQSLNVYLSVIDEGDKVKIVVEDDGVGIEKSKLEEIMNLKTDRVGLATVLQAIKEVPHAEIDIQSEINKGTKTTIRLKKGAQT